MIDLDSLFDALDRCVEPREQVDPPEVSVWLHAQYHRRAREKGRRHGMESTQGAAPQPEGDTP
jgi:hypothetical protein